MAKSLLYAVGFLLFYASCYSKIIGSDYQNSSSLLANESVMHESTSNILKPPVEDEGGGQGQTSDNSLLNGQILTEIKIHPNGSAMASGNDQWDSIVSDLLNQKKGKEISNKSQNKNLNSQNQTYRCIKCQDYECDNPVICYNAVQCFQARQRDSTGTETYSRGCIEKVDQIGFVCSSSFQLEVEALLIKCCQGNLCNDEDYPHLPYPAANSFSDKNFELIKLSIYVILGTVTFVSLFVLVVYILITRYFFMQKKTFSHPSSLNPFSSMYRHDKFESGDDSVLRNMINESISSGSGSGFPLFVQRTLAKTIYLEDIIGKGRYGEVWKGSWHGEPVAVKIFVSCDEASWVRETEIYSVLLRHDNILCFYGSDKTCRASCTQLWLVTHYHPNGSLHNYLKSHTLDHKDLLLICLSIINGLLHLHTEIMGTQGKPAIAHRDLNSNNILVKDDYTCCISDFGLAVVRNSTTEEIDTGNSDRSVNKRYASPEVLNGTIDMENFESFRKADIYSVALVMWEACRRCLCNGIAEKYLRPYENIFPEEPTYEEMEKLVCVQGTRPLIPNRWTDDKILSNIEKILSECWHQNPNVRLTALRIKKNLLKISSEEIFYEFKGSNKV